MIKRKILKIAIVCTSLTLLNTAMFTTAIGSIGIKKAPVTQKLNINQNLIKIVQQNLPKGAILTNPINPKGTNAIQLKDINGDGQNEIIAVFKINEEGKVGFIVLTETRDKRSLIKSREYITEGIAVDFLKFAPITAKNKTDIVFGWTIGATAKNMDIFTWKNGWLTKIANAWYTKIEVADMPNKGGKKDGIAEIALWNHDTGEAYITGVYRWDGSKLVIARDVYPIYFKKVAAYYKEKVNEEPNAAFYWYYLADAQLKAENPKAAIEAANRGLAILKKFPDYYPEAKKFEDIIKAAEALEK
jgi:hypothetical protein